MALPSLEVSPSVFASLSSSSSQLRPSLAMTPPTKPGAPSVESPTSFAASSALTSAPSTFPSSSASLPVAASCSACGVSAHPSSSAMLSSSTLFAKWMALATFSSCELKAFSPSGASVPKDRPTNSAIAGCSFFASSSSSFAASLASLMTATGAGSAVSSASVAVVSGGRARGSSLVSSVLPAKKAICMPFAAAARRSTPRATFPARGTSALPAGVSGAGIEGPGRATS
mmetsp:Transcript_1224/g.3559  ORF Transcript_1224/g.3559 Transcript_1224/m.3559 type:complete len:229 (-) Transcript_1224:540-1226(-)